MAISDAELKSEVRDFTGIDVATVGGSEFDTVVADAKRHIKIERSMNESEVDWYNDPHQEDALNWATKLFLKVAAGELDSQTIQVGAIDHDTLLSKDDDSVTIWFRKMQSSMNKINPATSYGVRSTGRRTYGSEDESSGGSDSLSL